LVSAGGPLGPSEEEPPQPARTIEIAIKATARNE
jgi:hypothetical protein